MKSRKFLRWGYNTLVVILLLTGIYFVVAHFVHFGNSEIIDNATIYRHITPVNTRVQGFIREIRFDDYQEVHKGDTLVVIDDSEFCLRLAQAEADLASATAGGRVTSSGVNTAQRQVNVSMAGIEEARVHLENAEREEKRYAQLLKNDAVTPQQYDAVHTAYLSAKARYEQALRQSSALTAVKTEQNHRLGQTDAAIRLAKAQVDMARLNLSYTVIVATADGVVGRKDIHVGQLVQPGQTLVSLVDKADVWVVANYRETQLPNIKIGAPVEVKVDAVPGRVFEGTVERISDATCAASSLIPQDNATGNFVKVEQRVPVRIRLKASKDLEMLRAGLNVETSVAY